MARSQKVIRIRKTAVVAAGLLVLLGGGMATAQASNGGQDHQSWVCKYVGTPGVDERLKEGKQPIIVDTSATVGTWFNDGQNNSFVLELATEGNTGSGERYTGDLTCPVPVTPPTETTPPTTTTTTATTPPTTTTTTTTATTPPTTTTTTTTTTAPVVVKPKAPESVQVLGVSETAQGVSAKAKGVSAKAKAGAGAPKSLAFTGPAEILPLGIVGLLALALGGVLTAVARRRVRS